MLLTKLNNSNQLPIKHLLSIMPLKQLLTELNKFLMEHNRLLTTQLKLSATPPNKLLMAQSWTKLLLILVQEEDYKTMEMVTTVITLLLLLMYLKLKLLTTPTLQIHKEILITKSTHNQPMIQTMEILEKKNLMMLMMPQTLITTKPKEILTVQLELKNNNSQINNNKITEIKHNQPAQESFQLLLELLS